MTKRIIYGILTLVVMYACTRVPITNRKQLLLIPDSEMNAMSFASYKQFLDTNKVVTPSNAQAQMVKRVGDRIAQAAKLYFESVNHAEYLNGYQWQTELVQNNQVNAWCMPGGKMVVYTGILPVTQTEGGLAVVMGHEVSHAIAKHGSERMSQGMLAQGLLVGGQVALGISMRDKPRETQALWSTALGVASVGTQVGLLAFSRQHESEADHLGLIFMSIAGYNPQEAIPFWQRMAVKAGNGQKPPEFLSTHPSDETRIRQITGWLPEAMNYYNKSTMR
jgi:predicted Zn-dependent protease